MSKQISTLKERIANVKHHLTNFSHYQKIYELAVILINIL